jgi:hypothetical protein
MSALALVGPGGRLELDRRTLETLAEVIVALLDIAEPEPDVEPNGDELDGNGSEDDFMLHYTDDAGGCPLSDPGGGDVVDEPHDIEAEDGV